VRGVSQTNDITLCNFYFEIKGQNSSKRSQNGMKFYHILELLTNKLQSKFQLDIWKKNEIHKQKTPNEQTDRWTHRHCCTIVYVPSKDEQIKVLHQFLALSRLIFHSFLDMSWAPWSLELGILATISTI
jgi:hypothetical protein